MANYSSKLIQMRSTFWSGNGNNRKKVENSHRYRTEPSHPHNSISASHRTSLSLVDGGSIMEKDKLPSLKKILFGSSFVDAEEKFCIINQKQHNKGSTLDLPVDCWYHEVIYKVDRNVKLSAEKNFFFSESKPISSVLIKIKSHIYSSSRELLCIDLFIYCRLDVPIVD